MREVTSRQEFEDAIQGCVVVDFYADWCGPCKQMEPALQKASAEIVKVNVDELPGLAQEYGIRSVPTLMAFTGGEALSHTVGSASKSDIESLYQSCA